MPVMSSISSLTSLNNNDSLKYGLVAATTAAAVLYSAKCLYRASQLPEGPWGLPFLGRLPWIDANHFDESIDQMRQQYGPIFSFRAGQRLMIVVSSQELLKQMLHEEIFAGRLVPPQVKEGAKGCGIAFTEGSTWRNQRRVCLRVLREFGFGKQESVDTIHDEVTDILQQIESKPTNVNTFRLFTGLSNSTVSKLLFGRRYANEDNRFDRFIQDLAILIGDGLSGSLTLLFPSIAPLLRFLIPKTKQAVVCAENITSFIEQEIAQRESQLVDLDAEPLCLCDAYIRERRLAEAKGDYETYKPFHLVRICMEMFIAGTETSAKSLEWLMVYMSVYPDVQTKVQLEIDTVVGHDRRPKLSDREKLHYTQAVIDESFRVASIAYNGVSHRALQDAEFHGYRIPSDAVIIPFVFGAHRDSSVWKRPHDFYPEHFLDHEGVYTPSKNLVPFLNGKRVCPGESLARLEIFLAFLAVMQRYRVQLSLSCREKAAEVMRGMTSSTRGAGPNQIDFHSR